MTLSGQQITVFAIAPPAGTALSVAMLMLGGIFWLCMMPLWTYSQSCSVKSTLFFVVAAPLQDPIAVLIYTRRIALQEDMNSTTFDDTDVYHHKRNYTNELLCGNTWKRDTPKLFRKSKRGGGVYLCALDIIRKSPKRASGV